jgi:acetoin utilization deacetylase AcuC-like enzyme
MLVFYSPDYACAGYAFDTTRKAGWIAGSLADRPIAGVELVAPEPAREAQLCLVHEPAYVAAVRTGEPRALAESQGFPWDPALWRAVRAATGGTVAAARAARRDGAAGSLSSGLHHAKRGRGDGFCTFNGLALAAYEALTTGARSVLILDLDAHCGGGTHSLVKDDARIRHADVAVNAFDVYAPVAPNTLELIGDADRYLPAIASLLTRLEASGTRFDLCLYNAGMDPYEGCEIGGLPGITFATLAARERVVFDWARRVGVPIAFVLAGGYTGARLSEAELVDLHRLTLAAAAGA